MREIIARGGRVPETAVMEDGQLVEYVQDEGEVLVDTVILGRVDRIVPGLKAAFVDIGDEKNGFLPLEEKNLMDPSSPHPLQPLQCGDRVLVQVRREASGEKGAFLSRDISLNGSLVILMPLNTTIGVSARITYEPRRAELKELGEHITGGEFGLVFRTSSEQAESRAIQHEVRSLKSVWAELEKAAATAHAPEIIYQKQGSAEALLIDYLPRGVDSITTDIPEIYENYHRKLDVYLTDSDPLKDRGIEAMRERALARRVWLKSGGSLIIDECEAMTVIDVNTAKSTGTKQDRQVLIRTNLEACHEIARQIRLRNLGGIILIDMIDMDTDEDRQIILNALEMDLKNDRVKTVVHGFTSLGLIEMTRRRTRKTLRQTYARPCPVCHGAGWLPKQEGESHEQDSELS